MYLASDLQDRAADATLAHELVHALQDQYYDLGPRLSYQPEANDRESAVQALAEGDATSAMMDLHARRQRQARHRHARRRVRRRSRELDDRGSGRGGGVRACSAHRWLRPTWTA